MTLTVEIPPSRNRLLQVVLPILILVLGAVGAVALVAVRSEPIRAAAQTKAALVTVVPAKRSTERVVISGFGTVTPKQELVVKSQVFGTIVSIHSNLEVGGRIEEGEVLVQIDPRDYEIAVSVEQASVAKAEFQLKLEAGNQIIAAREWKLLEERIKKNKGNKELALRQPHLREKRAALEAAKSRLMKATLDLERSTIRSPFSAIVLEESSEIGTYVSSQTVLAHLAGTDVFYVEVKVPRRDIVWLDVDDELRSQGGSAKVFYDFGNGNIVERDGRIIRLLGNVDSTGRMARVLVAIDVPLEQKLGRDTLPLLLGSYVKVAILGREVSNVFRFPRRVLREGGRVWIKNANSRLEFVPVELVFAQEDEVVVRGSLKDGDLVIDSQFQLAVEGVAVKVLSDGKSEAK